MTTTDNRHPGNIDEHILHELDFQLAHVGDELHGSATVVPEMFVPGTTSIRTSILATWADTASGHAVMKLFEPRVPVTLDLDVHVYAPPRERDSISAVARLIKAGRTVGVVEVTFAGSDGEPLAFAIASFMAAPNPSMTMPPDVADLSRVPRPRRRLSMPLAERARCTVREPGVAVLPRSDDGLNASNTVNGGLIALVAEEAALSVAPGDTLSSLSMRYLRPARVGPVVASARVHDGVGHVEVRDAGNDNRLAVLAITKTFGT